MKIFSERTPRVIITSKHKDLPEQLNPTHYRTVVTDGKQEESHIFEVDYLVDKFPEYFQDVVSFHPSNTIKFTPKLKDKDISTSNMMLVCHEIFHAKFGKDFHDNFHYYIIEKNRLYLIVSFDFAANLIKTEFQVTFNMNETYKLFFRPQIIRCNNKQCESNFHIFHSPENMITSPLCLQRSTTSYEDIGHGTDYLLEQFPNVSINKMTHRLVYNKAEFMTMENNTITRENLTYQESPSITHTQPKINVLTEITSVSSSYCMSVLFPPNINVNQVCNEKQNKFQGMVNLMPMKEACNYCGNISRIFINNNKVTIYWASTIDLYFLVDNVVILGVTICDSDTTPVKCEMLAYQDTITFTTQSSVSLRFRHSSIHSIKSTNLFLKSL